MVDRPLTPDPPRPPDTPELPDLDVDPTQFGEPDDTPVQEDVNPNAGAAEPPE